MESPSVYIPMDWRQALAHGKQLPERMQGAALFADISGFTPLTEALALELGPRRGAEELTLHLNRVYDALIAQLHRFSGSVIGFSGDAITCWLDGDDGRRATASALAMQQTMQQFADVKTFSGKSVSLGVKAAVAIGPVRRFVVGDADYAVVDAMAGKTLEVLAMAEHHAERGDVIVDEAVVEMLGEGLQIAEWRRDEPTGHRFAVVRGLTYDVPEKPWPSLPDDALSEEQSRAWLLPHVYERLQRGQGEFLAELRPAVALFLRFGGIDYELDPEAPIKLDTFIGQVAKILLQYDGSLIQLTIGDKGSYLYAAFGAPVAHEDDAIRACTAALELQSLASRLEFLDDLQIGVTKGRMRTGAYGSSTRRTYGVLGDAVNLAARLMSAAQAGQILVGDAARGDTGNAFEWERLPNIRVKGKTEPVTLSLLAGLKSFRGDRLAESAYSLPMVGRTRELSLITQKLELARAGKGQIVIITAEAGMGKSRLAAEVIHLANEMQFVGYAGECQSYGTNTSYLVWHNIWRGFFGLDPALELSEQMTALEQQLREINPSSVRRLPLLGAAMNLTIPDNELTGSLDAKTRKSSLETTLVESVRARAQTESLLLVLEDCHWLDPLSNDLLEVIGRTIADLPVVMLLMYRPPESQDLKAMRVSQLPHTTQVSLTEFTLEEAGRLIQLKLRQFFGADAAIPAGFLERINARAAGNPFYIEELLNFLRDRNIDPHDNAALDNLDLPSSLYSLILSRIDQLSESQNATIKVASVIGRLFSAAMLWGVYPDLGTEERVRTELDALSTLELTPLDTPEPELTYLFKHVIIKEIAYESLLYSTRAMLHEEVGKYIETRYSESIDQYLNILAYHYDYSENELKKREYLLKAGRASQSEYANDATINYYRKALPLLTDVQKLELYHELGHVLELVGQWDEAGETYQSALSLAQRLPDRKAEARYRAELAELARKQGEFDQCSVWLEQSRAIFEELGDSAGVAHTLAIAGILATQQGDYDAARDLWQQSLVIRRQLDEKPRIAALLSNLGIVADLQGDNALALKLYEEALEIRRELGDPPAIANSLNNLGFADLEQGDLARSRLEEALALQREVGDRFMIGNALNNLGNVVRAQGDYKEAKALYDESLTIYRELGDKWALSYLFEDVGLLAAFQGQALRAVQLTTAASALREEIGTPRSPSEQEKIDNTLTPAIQSLDEATMAEAVSNSQAMSVEEMISFALTD